MRKQQKEAKKSQFFRERLHFVAIHRPAGGRTGINQSIYIHSLAHTKISRMGCVYYYYYYYHHYYYDWISKLKSSSLVFCPKLSPWGPWGDRSSYGQSSWFLRYHSFMYRARCPLCRCNWSLWRGRRGLFFFLCWLCVREELSQRGRCSRAAGLYWLHGAGYWVDLGSGSWGCGENETVVFFWGRWRVIDEKQIICVVAPLTNLMDDRSKAKIQMGVRRERMTRCLSIGNVISERGNAQHFSGVNDDLPVPQVQKAGEKAHNTCLIEIRKPRFLLRMLQVVGHTTFTTMLASHPRSFPRLHLTFSDRTDTAEIHSIFFKALNATPGMLLGRLKWILKRHKWGKIDKPPARGSEKFPE